MKPKSELLTLEEIAKDHDVALLDTSAILSAYNNLTNDLACVANLRDINSTMLERIVAASTKWDEMAEKFPELNFYITPEIKKELKRHKRFITRKYNKFRESRAKFPKSKSFKRREQEYEIDRSNEFHGPPPPKKHRDSLDRNDTSLNGKKIGAMADLKDSLGRVINSLQVYDQEREDFKILPGKSSRADASIVEVGFYLVKGCNTINVAIVSHDLDVRQIFCKNIKSYDSKVRKSLWGRCRIYHPLKENKAFYIAYDPRSTSIAE